MKHELEMLLNEIKELIDSDNVDFMSLVIRKPKR